MKKEVVKAYSDKMKAVNAFFAKAEKFGGVHNVHQNLDKYAPDEFSLLESSKTADDGVSVTSLNYDGIDVELITPDNLSGSNIIYYIHGGAFTYGDVLTSRPVAAMLAKETGLRTFTITYRLAPEHKFPAAVNDCFAVYKKLLSEYPDALISIVGESAGANCSMTTALLAKQDKLVLPSSIVLISYPGDFSQYIKGGANEAAEPWLRSYIGEESPLNPLISPNFGDINGFPPLKIIVDSAEVFRADCDCLAEKADKLGIEVDYQIWEDTFHAFPAYPTSAKDTPESEQVVREISTFILKYSL